MAGEDLPADGVVTGVGRIDGRPVCVMANDPTVKAGSWGARTVEKIVRLTEYALRHELPVFWLVDSAGARITDQVELFPGRRGAGPHLLQPGATLGEGARRSAACSARQRRGRGLHPELLRPRGHGRGQRVDVPGLAADGRDGHQRADDARGDGRRPDARHGVGMRRQPRRRRRRRHRPGQGVLHLPARPRGGEPAELRSDRRRPAPFTADLVPADEHIAYDIHDVIDALVDAESFFEVKPLFAPELVVGFALLDGRPIGIVANNPAVKGGVLFVDSADKAARFIWECDAFNVPLVFLADVPGFMIGTEVERQGIIRHGAKMVTAVSEATVPKVSVILRKAYGAGLYAMSGPAFEPEATLALPDGQDRRDGPRGGGQRRVRQQDRGDRGPRRAGGVRRRAAPPLRGGRRPAAPGVASSSSTPWSSPGSCGEEIVEAPGPGRRARTRAFSDRRHGVPPV